MEKYFNLRTKEPTALYGGLTKNKKLYYVRKSFKIKRKIRQSNHTRRKNAVDLEMKKLQDEDMDAWANAMVESAKKTADRAEALVKQTKVREQLENALPILPLSYIAEHYFKKSRQWLYQRLNGNIVNGKPAQFTDEEINTLNTALQDISKKIGSLRVA